MIVSIHGKPGRRGCRRWWRKCSRWARCYRSVAATTAASVPLALDQALCLSLCKVS